MVTSSKKYNITFKQIQFNQQMMILSSLLLPLLDFSQAFSRKDGPIRNTVISHEKYKPD